MSPKLRGEDIPRGTGPAVQRHEPRDGEVLVECPPEPGCDWSTVRPAYAARSAGEAHRIRVHPPVAAPQESAVGEQGQKAVRPW